RFDLDRCQLISLHWKQKDERDQGPVSPASVVESTTRLTRTPIEQPKCLDDVALVSVSDGLKVPAPLTNLFYHDAKGRFDLVYGREWQAVSRTDEHRVLRLLDPGDFVAEVTVTPWRKSEPGEHLTPEDFGEEMANTPGWELEEVLQAGEVPSDDGRW